MAEIKEIVEDENKIDTVIADDIAFRGKLIFKNSLKIKGSFEGKIESTGHLIIGQEAKVNANIDVATASVNGAVTGKLKAKESVELYSHSKTSGDIVAPELHIEKGAKFNGTCLMNDTEE